MTKNKYECVICGQLFLTLYRGGICSTCRKKYISKIDEIAEKVNARKEAIRLFKAWYKYDPFTEGPEPEYTWFEEGEKMSKHFKDKVVKTIIDNDYLLTLGALKERFGCDKKAILKIMNEYGIHNEYKTNSINRMFSMCDEIRENNKHVDFNAWYVR